MVTIEELQKRFTEAWNKFEDWISTLAANVSGFVVGITVDLWNALSEAFSAFIEGVQEALSAADRALHDAKAYTDTLASDVAVDISSALDEAKTYVDGVAGAFADIAKDAIFDLITPIEDRVSDVEAGTTEVKSLVDVLKDGVDSVVGGLTTLVDTFDDWVKNSIEYLLNLFIETEDESKKYREEGVK